MYLIHREGIAIQGICGIYTTLELAQDKLYHLVNEDIDSYHTYYITPIIPDRPFGELRGYDLQT